MSEPSIFPHGITCLGDLNFSPSSELNLPAGSVSNADISSGADIDADKCERSLRAVHRQAGTATSQTVIAFVAKSAGTFVMFTVSQVTANVGSSTVTVDVKKNGTTILSGVVTLDSGDAAYAELTGAITTTTFADGDYITFVITATQDGTDALATGVMAQLDYNETYTTS